MEQQNNNKGSLSILKHPMEMRSFDEVLIRKVSKLGNSGHISIPVKHLGKHAQVIIWKEEDNE